MKANAGITIQRLQTRHPGQPQPPFYTLFSVLTVTLSVVQASTATNNKGYSQIHPRPYGYGYCSDTTAAPPTPRHPPLASTVQSLPEAVVSEFPSLRPLRLLRPYLGISTGVFNKIRNIANVSPPVSGPPGEPTGPLTLYSLRNQPLVVGLDSSGQLSLARSHHYVLTPDDAIGKKRACSYLALRPIDSSKAVMISREAGVYDIGMLDLMTGMATFIPRKEPWISKRLHHDMRWNPVNETFLVMYHHRVQRFIFGQARLMGDNGLYEIDLEGNVVWDLDLAPLLLPYWLRFVKRLGICANAQVNPEAQNTTNTTPGPLDRRCTDYLHCNTAFWDVDNDAIYVNSRRLSTFFKIRKSTGKLEWAVGAVGDFEMWEGGHRVGALFFGAHEITQIGRSSFALLDNNALRQDECTVTGLMKEVPTTTTTNSTNTRNSKARKAFSAIPTSRLRETTDRTPFPGTEGKRNARIVFVDVYPEARRAEATFVWNFAGVECSPYMGSVQRLPEGNILGHLSPEMISAEVQPPDAPHGCGQLVQHLAFTPPYGKKAAWMSYRAQRLYRRPVIGSKSRLFGNTARVFLWDTVPRSVSTIGRLTVYLPQRLWPEGRPPAALRNSPAYVHELEKSDQLLTEVLTLRVRVLPHWLPTAVYLKLPLNTTRVYVVFINTDGVGNVVCLKNM
eukprot:TRINITY_DN3212_c0_g1_i1.p1 TRINITY_DN3212_c0_g1~~TRINITY_DN3212_c0_g1_i1.p1  ORF type:complete len:675 (-),score=90.15 TRINITY_DN3212_c0_g1_i1:18-2042(-)